VKTVALGGIALVLLAAFPAQSQLSTSSELPYRNPGSTQDPTDAGVRRQNSTMGRTLDEWGRRLDDADPGKRLEAVRLLGESGDPKANQYLVRAADSPDDRVATAAIDSLGKLGAKEASDALAEKLFLTGTNPALRQHILVALGRIRDPGTARRVLDFSREERDPNLRAVAIRVLGEIGDNSVRNDVEKLTEAETDPRLKTLLQDALARMAVQGSPSRGEVELPSKFSHSGANP
jgi:HEAT repeat protein